MGKAKGTVVLKAVKVLRARKAEALAHLPKVLHHYLDDRIVVASGYPEEEFYELLCACATELHRLGGASAPTYSHPTCRHSSGDRCVFVVS